MHRVTKPEFCIDRNTTELQLRAIGRMCEDRQSNSGTWKHAQFSADIPPSIAREIKLRFKRKKLYFSSPR